MAHFDNDVKWLVKAQYKKLHAPELLIPRKRVLDIDSELDQAFPQWKSKTLQSFLRRTGNSDAVIRMVFFAYFISLGIIS